MIKIVLLGTGNVAGYFFETIAASRKLQVIQVYNHSLESLFPFSNKVAVTTSTEDLFEADIYLMAVKDDAILGLSLKLAEKKGLILHTSGAVPLDALAACSRRGVFYPLQTFSKNRKVTHRDIPFCLETPEEGDMRLLETMAEELGGISYQVNSEQRKKLHLAAVFVCNFVNHLYAIGEQICEQNALPFKILQPLIRETAAKISDASPFDSQTGPAKRNDLTTIKSHLDSIVLEENKEIYKLLTKAIQSAHGKEL